jgi:hypothetical protein
VYKREREREKKQRENKVFFLKNELLRKHKIKKIKNMPRYQGTGPFCPVALLAGFASKGKTDLMSDLVYVFHVGNAPEP